MKPALAQPRISQLVEEELRSLEETIARVPPPPPDDPAAALQWRAWNNHRAELEEELAAARRVEGELESYTNAVEAIRKNLKSLVTKVGQLFHSRNTGSASQREATGASRKKEHHSGRY